MINLADFFLLGSIPSNRMMGNYDLPLVLLSYAVAAYASYIALDITARLRDVGNTNLTSTWWLLIGSFAMGAGIWSMHFIGMLAFSMPNMVITFEAFWTGLSIIVAILASGFAFMLLKSTAITLFQLILGGIILGFAIASMHYVGMEGMRIVSDIHYLPSLFILSIIVAILASEAAIYLALKSDQVVANIRFRLKVISAFIMGLAICGMHYIGMAAAVFTPKEMAHTQFMMLDPQILSLIIAGVTFVILSIAAFLSTKKEAQNQQMLLKARQAGMAEVASSVLHNVGNVLNSVNISVTMLTEKITHSKLEELKLLGELIDLHQHDLAAFITKDPKGKAMINYIKLIGSEWENEKAFLIKETTTLIKNIGHIKNVISMQQNLSKVINQDQRVSITSLIEEALLLTSIDSNFEFKIEKKFQNLKPILIDKVKVLQILINILHNAKDSLKVSIHSAKCIIIKTYLENNKVAIQISDNGLGIKPENISRIFSYGYSTKENGHGFGLHSSAIAAKEMGGMIKVNSEGHGKGATFTLILPYK